MNLTTTEIRHVIKIARDNPEMAPEEIINAIVDGYMPKEGIRGFLQKISLNVRKVINDEPINFKPTTAEIFRKVCKYHKTPIDLVRSKTREKEIVIVRQQYCLVGFLFQYTWRTIADGIGKNHATAIHHKKKAIGYCETEKIYYQDIENIILKFPEFKTILMERFKSLLKTDLNERKENRPE